MYLGAFTSLSFRIVAFLEHQHQRMLSYSILSSQKATLLFIPYYFQIPPTSQNSIFIKILFFNLSLLFFSNHNFGFPGLFQTHHHTHTHSHTHTHTHTNTNHQTLNRATHTQSKECCPILFYYLKNPLYYLYHTILQYLPHPKTLFLLKYYFLIFLYYFFLTVTFGFPGLFQTHTTHTHTHTQTQTQTQTIKP